MTLESHALFAGRRRKGVFCETKPPGARAPSSSPGWSNAKKILVRHAHRQNGSPGSILRAQNPEGLEGDCGAERDSDLLPRSKPSWPEHLLHWRRRDEPGGDARLLALAVVEERARGACSGNADVQANGRCFLSLALFGLWFSSS